MSMSGIARNIRLNMMRGAALYGYAFQRERAMAPPLYVNIDLTNACNYKCVMCPQSSPGKSVKRGKMGFGLFKKLIADIKGFAPIEQLSLFLAGEPLLSLELEKCVRTAYQELGIRPNIASNLSLLTTERASSLIDAGLGSVVVDFCADKKVFEKFRKGGNWERTRGNIGLLVEAKRKMASAYPLITLKDISGLPATHPEGRALKALFPEGIHSFQEYRFHNWGGLTGEKKGLANGSYFPCSHLWFNMPVQYDGKVSACCRDAEARLIVGDAKKESLKEIWNGVAIRALRRALIQKKYRDIPLCSGCDRLWTGGYFGGRPVQLVKRLLKSRPGGFRLLQVKGEKG